MTRAHRLRNGTMISLLGCLLLSTPVLAQTGGVGGSVNGGAAPAPGSEAGIPAGIPVIPGTVENAAPAKGTYGGMESTPRGTFGTRPNCSLSGPNCYNLNSFPQEMPSPPPAPPDNDRSAPHN
jgi:hypothetical protein